MRRLIDDPQHAAPEENKDLSIEIDAFTIKERPARAAYLLVEKIYTWFGAATNQIPYTTGQGDAKIIDVDIIRRGGKAGAAR